MSEQLSGKQLKKLSEALTNAFPTEAKLEQMLRFELDKKLNLVTTGDGLEDIAFKLIQTAEAEDWLKELIRVAKLKITPDPKKVGIPNRNPNFTGREKLLKDLEASLSQGSTTALTQAIHGLGGIGKTQLAIEYINRYKDNYKTLRWINSENVATLRTEFAAFAVELNLVDEDAEFDTKVNATRNWLETNSGWLIVFDNVEKPSDVKPYLITVDGGHNLITSRHSDWGAIAGSLKVTVWSPEEASEYLEKRLNKIYGFTFNDEETLELAEEMGYLPLALAQAAGYMGTTSCSLNDYIRKFRNRRDALWEREETPSHYNKDKEKGTVKATWSLALEQIESVTGARELMNICSYLAPENIPLSLLTDHAEVFDEPLSDVLKDEFLLDDALAALLSYSLIDKSDSFLSVHRLLQTVVRDSLDEEWLKVSLALLGKAFKFDMNEFETWEVSVPLAPHVKQVIEHAGEMKEEDLAWLYFSLASYHSTYIILYQEAEVLFKKSIAISKETVGEEHADHTVRLNDFALLLHNMGRYNEAEPLYRQAIEIDKITVGDKHPSYATRLNNLAGLLSDMGCYDDAESLYRQAIEVDKITIGDKHPSYATRLNNLANLLYNMGRYDAAEPLYRQAIEIDKITVGDKHPSYAIRLNNLAILLRVMDRYDEAEPLYRQAIEIDKITVGDKHPSYARDLNNLASLLKDMGRYDDAEPLYQQAIAICTETLGEEHPNTKTAKQNYQDLLDRQTP